MTEKKDALRWSGKKKVSVWVFIFLLGFASLFAFFWFSAIGVGEYKDSPDGRYIASLSLYTQRTLFDGKVQYVGIEIEEKYTGETIWSTTYHPRPGANPYIYGDRSKEFIRWEVDSSAVHFPLDVNGMEITVPLP